MAWWEDGEILGGKDEVAGGTWLACSRQGRVAFVTNVLELDFFPDVKSRGDLPLRFLKVSKFTAKNPPEKAINVVPRSFRLFLYHTVLI